MPADVPEPPPSPVTFRAMAIACALMPLMAMWVVLGEMVWDSAYPTTISLFFHVVFVVLLMSAGNLWLKRVRPAWALSAGELMTIYMMLSVAGALCSHDLLQILFPMLAFPDFNANPLNNWDVLLLPHVQPWSILTDTPAQLGLAVGNGSIYRWATLQPWLAPIGFWGLFVLALMGALISINVFVRQHWTERERLSFPVIQIPLAIVQDLPALLRSRLFWIAFVIAGGIDVLNGFSFLFPNIPTIHTNHAFEFRDYFVEPPWSAISNTWINILPFAIGLSFLIPTDLAFSCWFFFIVYKLQMVLTAAVGIRDLPGFPFPSEQAAGGYLAIGLLALWVTRRHLLGVVRRILGRPAEAAGVADDRHEPLSYRANAVVFLMCTAVLVSCGVALGASLWVMLVFFALFFLYSIAIARMRAELGPPAHDLHYSGPNVLIQNALGTRALGEGNMATFAQFYWFNRAYRAHVSAHSLEGFKIAQLMRITSRSIYGAMLLAVLVGTASAFWAMLHALYVHGYSGRISGDAYSQEAWNTLSSYLIFPQQPRFAATTATLLGGLFALLLGALRMRFTWWSLHPVGFATSTSWSMEMLWSCIFIGWLCRMLITRYGGAAAYRRALPFFIGLVLGEFVIGGLWSIYGAVAGTKVYCFWGL